MKMYEEVEVQLHAILTQELDKVSHQLHAPGALHARERTPSTHWIGLQVGTTASL